MKKIFIILFILCSCSNIKEIKNVGKEENIKKEYQYINGYYVEKTDDIYKTTITFKDDGSVFSTLNICNSIIEIKGNYEYIENKIYISFKDTGLDFIDNNEPFIFNVISNNEIQLDKKSTSYSCLLIDKYELQK